MKRAGKLWFIFCMLCVVGLGTTACMSVDPELQNKINVKLDRLSDLSAEMSEAYKRYKSGELKVSEFKDLTTAIKTTITETKDEVQSMREEGVGAGSLIGATLLGLMARGVPSKGPLGLLFGLFAKRRKEE